MIEVDDDVAFEADGDEAGDASPAAGRTDAAIYIDLARAVISAEFTLASGITRWDVRTWWRDEGPRRKDYGLSPSEEAGLMELCRAACDPLPEGAKNPSEWEDKPKDTKPKRAARPRARSPV